MLSDKAAQSQPNRARARLKKQNSQISMFEDVLGGNGFEERKW
jgi:hypothetical protein